MSGGHLEHVDYHGDWCYGPDEDIRFGHEKGYLRGCPECWIWTGHIFPFDEKVSVEEFEDAQKES